MSVDEAHPLLKIYHELCQLYGPQGWWPLLDLETKNPEKTGSKEGYHPLNYDIPENEEQKFEIIMGTILTQNTSWTSAEMALRNLKEKNAINPINLLELDQKELKSAIRCAGFLNQKSAYLKNISRFFLSLEGQTPSRNELLLVKGVGNETADSILLYAYKKPEFVVDTYTKRIFLHLGFISENAGYIEIKKLFEDKLPGEISIYQEYHALIVEHAKRYFRKKPYGARLGMRFL
jgi:endonuclease-3 related protein